MWMLRAVGLVVFGLCMGACEDSVSGPDPMGPPTRDLGPGILDAEVLLDGDAPDTLSLIDAFVQSDAGVSEAGPLDMGSLDAEVVNCVPNEALGCADIEHQRFCNDEGTGYTEIPCGAEERCEDGDCIPTACGQDELSCIDAQTLGACRRDGTGFIPIRTCNGGSPCINGACQSNCNPEGKVPSNIGCEYWSVDLDNYPDPFSNDPSSVPHAVVISNTSELPATVTIQGPVGLPLVEPQFVVDAGDLHVFTFPRLDIDGTGIFDRAFKINSTQPVIAYQFNPLNNEGVASNDASLLLPKEGLGQDYIGVSWPTGTMPCFDANPDNCLPPQSGYLTIVATSRGRTVVRITPTATVAAGGMIPELPREVEHEFELREGEVLSVQALENDLGDAFPPCMANEDCPSMVCIAMVCVLDIDPGPSTDLTGSIITASQPIAVFGGHEEAVVGQGGECCAEHLEQQLLPITSWGTHYLAARSEPRGGSDEVWRVIGQADGTNVQTTLAGAEERQFTLNRGEFREISTPDSFEVTAAVPVMVAQYLVSQGNTRANVGDPALIIVPPTNQLRDSYQIITPSGYASNWLTVARAVGQTVSLDGVVLDANRFTPFGSNQYEYAWLEVEEGVHNLEGTAPFALTVYGYSGAVSYGYPGGLNLRSDQME